MHCSALRTSAAQGMVQVEQQFQVATGHGDEMQASLPMHPMSAGASNHFQQGRSSMAWGYAQAEGAH